MKPWANLVVLALLMAWMPLEAQTFGTFTGVVTDSSSAVIAGAKVTITNSGTNQMRQAETNANGNYTVPFLVPGTYTLEAQSGGFRVTARRNVTLQVDAVVRIDFTLELGPVTESIEVTGGAPLLNTDSTAIGTVIENQRIVELPLNGRNYLQLIALSPNVTAEMGAGGAAGSRQSGDRANQAFSIAGQRMQFNRYMLDGVENTDVNFNTFLVRPSIEALQEFKVMSGVYSAEFGRATSQIHATTKSGTNGIHGSLFEFLRNDKIDAKEWRQEGEKNPFRRNQFGFTLSGPIVRDRLFFLSNYEGLRDRKTLQGTANVATARMRAGDFTGQTRPIFDPLTRVFGADAQGNRKALSAEPFPNQTIPQTRFNSVAQQLLEFYPDPTVSGDNIVRNYVRQRSRPIDQDQFIQRLDWNQNERSNWFGRFSWGDEYVGQTANFPDEEGRVTSKVYQAMLSNTRVFSPTIVNEFRFGYSQFQNDNLQHFAYLRDVTSELGIVGLGAIPEAAWGSPSITFGDGLTGFGDNLQGPFISRDHVFQWLDNLSIIRGRHSIKIGAEVRRDRFNQFGNSHLRGQFQFQPKATFDPASRNTSGHSFADYLIGESRRSVNALGAAIPLLRATSLSFYAEDSWKITPKLTMNIGLRYENTPPFHDKYRGVSNLQMFDPGVGDYGLLEGTRTPILTRPGTGDFYEGLDFRHWDGVPTQVGDDFIGRALVQRDNNDIAPRLGFAYSPNDKWSFRTGIGLFYAQDIGNARFDPSRNLAGRADFSADEEAPNSNLSDPFAFQRQNYTCSNWEGTCIGPALMLISNVGRRTPYVAQWLLNVQHEVSEDVSLEIGYQGNSGTKLEHFRYYNIAVPKTGLDDSSTIPQRQPWPEYGLMAIVDGAGKSEYHALSAKLQQRLSKGLTYLIGYTWSKSIDNVSALRVNSGERSQPKDSYNLQDERGLSQFHTGRRLVGSFIYELPFGHGKAFLNQGGFVNALLGGWQLGSILTFSDGTPWNAGAIGDTNNTGETNLPDATGISPIPDNRSAEQFWNINAFDAANQDLTVRFGNVGRNVLLRPGLRQWDFSLIKSTSIREGHTLQFRFEAFNFSNHPNWNPPSNNVRSAAFGVVTSARTMREVQFGLKYLF